MKNILLPIDLFHQNGWEGATAHAISLARLHGATLHVLTVIPSFGMPMVGAYFPRDYADKARAETEAKLAAFAETHIPADIDTKAHVMHGSIYAEILSVADAISADMIVMASHRPEMRDYLLGPNAARVVRHARQSVCVIR